MKNGPNFRLKVDKIDKNCRFELSWGKGQHSKPVFVYYPENLIQSYQKWKRAYRQYYQHNIRGRKGIVGARKSINPRKQLKESEGELLTKFKTWLGRQELSAIRTTIARQIKQEKWAEQNSFANIDIFFTCSNPELERLPWEVWELENEIASPLPIRLIRTPTKIHSTHATSRNQSRHSRIRILAIFGDQTGLDLKEDHQVLTSISSLAELKIITSPNHKSNYPDKNEIAQYKTKICQEIADNKGWDILFFAGHSDENTMMGGELGIAPGISIFIEEIKSPLKTAQEKGLQFALFNSCSGLNIAHTLIDLGLNQVAIMREPIADKVAQEFLTEFLQHLAEEKDVCDVLRETCQSLKKNLNYPSAYLIPSLFAHPEAPFYKIKPFGWKTKLKQWFPTRPQAIALSTIISLSLLSPVQEFLLDKRTFIQAIYRDLTAQIPPHTPPNNPPILLISIDEESLNQEKIVEQNPLNRKYLAKIIDRLSTLNSQPALNPQVIGIDYLLDRPQSQNDPILSKSLQDAIKKHETSFIFAATLEGEKEIGISSEIATLNSVMQGSIEASPLYLAIPDDCTQTCPFGYLIAVNQALFETEMTLASLTPESDYKKQIFNSLHQTQDNEPLLSYLKQFKKSPITQISEYFRQRWLQPITDFSLPPETIYQTLPAWQLLEEYQQPIDRQVVLIASGGYAEAGIDGEKDYVTSPLAIAFWQAKTYESTDKFTGGEIHAYMIHHWLKQHLVIPIPDLWLILVAALLGKTIEQWFVSSFIHKTTPKTRLKTFSGDGDSERLILQLLSIICNLMYIWLSLQAYVTFKIILPWLLPSLAFWLYILPLLRRSSS